jgi:hypothetical protein
MAFAPQGQWFVGDDAEKFYSYRLNISHLHFKAE